MGPSEDPEEDGVAETPSLSLWKKREEAQGRSPGVVAPTECVAHCFACHGAPKPEAI